MKNRKALFITLGIVSLGLLAYCLFACIYIQTRLIPSLEEIPTQIETIGNLIIPALLVTGIYHLMLLFRALRSQTGKFIDSVYIVLIIISGITLLSDLTLLNDIGKEYALWDVGGQWAMVYAFMAVHVLTVVWGLLRAAKRQPGLAPLKESIRKEGMSLSLYQIGLICGILGILGVVFAYSGLVVPNRFSVLFSILIAGLALFPLVLFVVYWLIRLKNIPAREWLDEKQLVDTAFAALIGFFVAVPLYVVICILDVIQVQIPVSAWILGIFFVQLSVLSSVVIARNR